MTRSRKLDKTRGPVSKWAQGTVTTNQQKQDKDAVKMDEARGDGRTAQNADNSNSRKSDEASGAAEKGSSEHGGSSCSTSQARSRNDTRKADAKPDDVQMDNHDGGASSDKRKDQNARRLSSRSQWNFLRRNTKAAPTQRLQQNTLIKGTNATTLNCLMTS